MKRDIVLDERAIRSSIFKIIALGINYDCEIFINDILIGKHSGGYTSFELEIPEGVLHSGDDNRLQIFWTKPVEYPDYHSAWTQVSGWKNFNGIIRDIYLLATPKFWMNTVNVYTLLNEEMTQGIINVKAVLQSRNFFTVLDSTENKEGSLTYV